VAAAGRASPDGAAEPSGFAAYRDLTAKSRAPHPFGLVRDRLLGRTDGPVLLVLAPAGHGKTTLLSQLAARFDGRVAWYRVETSDRDPATFAAGLCRVLAAAAGLGRTPDDLTALADALGATDASPAEAPARTSPEAAAQTSPEAAPEDGRRWLLLVDDVHELAGSDSERDLAHFLSLVPAGLGVALAARRVPGLDSTALKITRTVDVIESDDLRFRSWEVERLFRDVYQEPLAPEDAAALSRRTEGWAAGLAMFHLATAGQPPVRRRQALEELSHGSRLVRGYLVREVLGELPADTRSFLRRTSSLGVLTGDLCDALLDTDGSAAVLEALERRRLFIHVDRNGERYRYHQVLADHLELELSDQLGPQESRRWYRHTARVLLDAGEVRAGFRALARAEDWSGVEQLLREQGARVVAGALPATDRLLPADLHRHDPWLRLAEARRQRGRGALREAVEAYRQAAELAEDPDLVAACLAEARAAGVWLPDGEQPAAHGPFGLLRAATVRQPWQQLAALGARSDPDAVLAAGVVAALCGDVARAEQLLATAAEHPRATATSVGLTTCARAGLRLLSGADPLPEADLEAAVQTAEESVPWLARVARALLAAGQDETGTLPLLRICADVEGDRWGVGLITLVLALASGHPQDYRDACAALHEVGAPVVELWARSLAAVAADPGREGLADLARDARLLGVRDAPATANRWQARAGRAPAGLAPLPASGVSPAFDAAAPVFRLTLLGGFAAEVHGVPVDLSAVRPKARAMMHLLALHAPHWVHRDALAAALWPEATAEASLRSLQVAMSSLRTAVAAASGGRPALPARQGESYGLVLSEGVDSDVLRFEAALSSARSARARGDADAERQALGRAVDGYPGDLLPEDGPAEWVVQERDRLRLAAADAAHALAVSHAATGDGGAAIDDLRRCLRLDPYRDAGWKLLAELCREAGDPAAARVAETQRRRVLEELGISAQVSPA
jgi:DNA-binding SARP family transcriptional activator